VEDLLPRLPYAGVKNELGFAASISLWPTASINDLVREARQRWATWRSPSADAPAPAASGEAPAPASGAPPAQACAQKASPEEPSPQPGEDDRGRGRARDLTALVASVREDRSGATAEEGEGSAAEEVVAIELVLWVEWVLRHMRRLSFFLLLSIVLTTLFVSSYPYRPQQLVQTISLFVFGAVVASLVWVIGSMNRHTALSRMTGTQPGELTWDRTLYANLALYAIVPLIALVSSQNAALRETLFKWVEPLVNYLVTA
jgi:hypothetical protein